MSRSIPFSPRARTLALAAIFSFSTFAVEAAPTTLPIPRPDALQPESVSAAFCADTPSFTGHLTASSASTAAVSRITNGTVYGYLSNVDDDWSCTAYYRYSGLTWNTSATLGTFDWGNLINSVSVACNWAIGSTDYLKANSTADCPDTDAEYALGATLSPQGVYVNNANHSATGQFSWVHTDCGTYYGAEPIKTGQSYAGTDTGNRPGSNCDPMVLDNTSTAQTVTYDSTAPTGTISIAGGAGYTATTAVTLTLSASDAVAGLGTMRFSNDNVNWSAWETYATSKAWTLTSGNATKTVYVQYRDLNLNASGSYSDTIVLDTLDPTVDFTTPGESSTTIQSSTSYSVAWLEDGTGSPVAARSLQRHRASISTPGSCAGLLFDPDGSASSAVSPVGVTGLLGGYCYVWIQTLTDAAGNQAAYESGAVLVDTTPGSPNPPDVDATGPSVFQPATNGTVYFRPAAAATIALDAWADDLESDLTHIRFQNLTGTGFSPSPGLPFDDTTFPYAQDLGFGATTTSGSIQVLSRNGAGTDSSVRTVTLTADANPATATFSVPAAGTAAQPSDAVIVTFVETDGSGAGIASTSLKRQKATYSGSTCGTFADDPTFTAVPDPISPYADDGLLVNTCYRYALALTDLVGNVGTSYSGAIVRDTTANLGQQRQHTFESWDLGGGDLLAVNVANGNLVLSHPVVSLPTRGAAAGLSLTYNHHDPADVGMTPGWRLDAFRRLALNPDGTVTFTDGDGSRHTFTAPVTVGNVTTYTRPTTLYATLVKDIGVTANEFVLTYRDQSKDKFDIAGSEGLLVREEDRFGNGLTLAYTASTNRISTITDTAAGRVINLSWDASNRLSQVQDWAWIDGSGVVQTTNTGARRTYRFFYDASSRLAGWAGPLNTTGSCPTGGSHLTCLAYPANGLDIAKTQTVTTAGASALSTTTRTLTSKVVFVGSNVAAVKDAQQVQDAGTGTTFGWETPTKLWVERPATNPIATAYGLVAQNDPYARVQSIWRDYPEGLAEIEQRTAWDATFPTEPASVTDNFGALLGTPARTITTTYVPSSPGLVQKVVEPLTGSTNRWTEYVYNANNDVTQKTVSQDGSSSLRTVSRSCYTTQSQTCATNETGLTLVRQIENWVSAGPQDDDTNVATDYTYDAFGRQTRVTRHNRDAAGGVRDDRVDALVYDAANLGNLEKSITNYVDGVVTNGTLDTTPGTDSVRTDLTTVHSYDTAGNRVSTADPRRAIGLAIPASTVYTFSPTDDAHVRSPSPDTQLVVANKAAPTAGDLAVRNRLVALGHTVTYVSDEDAVNVTGQELVVLAESTVATTLAGKYKNVVVPVLGLEHAVWDDMDFVASAASLNTTQTQVAVTDPAHPIAAGLSGTQTVYASAQPMSHTTAAFGAGVQHVMTIVGQATQKVGFAYPAGATMANGHVAEARRVGLGFTDLGMANVATPGGSLFDASVAWLINNTGEGATNYGSASTLEVRNVGASSSAYEPFLTFEVTGLVGTVTAAALRFENTAASNDAGRSVCALRVPSTAWTESALTWATKPPSDASPLVCVVGSQAQGAVDFILPSGAVAGPGVYAYRLTSDRTTSVIYASKEHATLADPQMRVSVSFGPLAADDWTTRWTYDALGQRLTEKSPKTFDLTDQKTATTTYDELGAARQQVDFNGLLTTGTEYDRAGRGTKTFEDTDAGGAIAPATTSITTYDAAGLVLTTKDRNQAANANLGVTRNDYDSLGRLELVTDAFGSNPDVTSDTLTGYDALDRATLQSYGGLDTVTTYDLGGRSLSTDDDFTCATSTYDYRDLALTTTSGLLGGTCASAANTRTVTHSLDGLGRAFRTEVTAGTGTGDRTTDVTLDSAGNTLTSASRKAGVTTTTTFAITKLDQSITEVRPDGSTSKMAYDPAGNTADKCYWEPAIAVGDCLVVGTPAWANPPTQSTSTTYDARNQRIQLVDGLTNAITIYDPDHAYQPKASYLPTGQGREFQTLYAYDSRHRLANPVAGQPAITHQLCVLSNASTHTCSSTTPLGSVAYAYDDNDNRTTVNESNGATSSDRRYCYDALDQLRARNTAAACTITSGDETYTYDDAGNRLTAPGDTFTYSGDGQLCQIDIAGQCPTNLATWQIPYDSAGRTLGYNGWTFAYDSQGRMTSACKSSTCATGFDKVEFAYDGEGHRTKLTTTSAAGAVATREFRYQGEAIVEEKLTDAAHPAGAVVRSYVVDDAGSAVELIIPPGEPDAGTYLVTWSGHGDALGLWRQNADGTLTLANSYTYDTWGRPTTATHAGVADLGFRFLYVGEFDVQWDDAFGLGLFYMHARHYSPTLGRFLQPDPDGSETNLYAYTANNPVTELDPDGTCFILCIVVGVALFGALGTAGEVANYAMVTPSDDWSSDGAADAAGAGFVKGASVVPIVRGAGLLAKALNKVPRAARAPKWVTSNRARPALNRSAGNNTVQKIWEKARPVPGGRACSTKGCPNVLVEPTKGVRRNFDMDHIVKWRTFRPLARVMERVWPGSGKALYNLRVNLRARCTACNRADQ